MKPLAVSLRRAERPDITAADPVTGTGHQAAFRAAISALRELAAPGAAGAHRVRVPDALIAAAADRGFSVLHSDRHFDRLATVLRFESQWIAPSGSIQ